MGTSRDHSIQSLETSLDILEALVQTDAGTVSELEAVLEPSKSTIYQHLETLRRRGYVEKHDDHYKLGLGLVTLGGYCRDNIELVKHGRSVVEEVADATGEYVTLAAEHQFRSMHVYRIEGKGALSMDTYLGSQFQLHATATGKAMMAAMEPEQVDTYIEEVGLTAFTDQTITNPDELRAELADTKERGYSLEDNERIDGSRGIGVPVTKRTTGETLGVLAVAGPSNRINGPRFREKLPDILQRHVEVIELNIVYS
ncbi:IclR family transcriptional regulator [Halobellus limi]|uniref:IclR family transcriptional regulator n=1 Tax=Halobellus limi TaxID=699433 RepID=A0A1H6BRS8_9EURY|nr:IclR family transcriptional regulator [Halobellus limi]QCC49367.1 IclR family transcriptional regulator [Halobellus limi]SEG63137.1 transcriptional regulator, IclR family [Halobellus limi]